MGLYVANFGGNVTEYGLPLGNVAAVAPNIDIVGANTLLFDSTGVAVAGDGDIYVADATNGMGDTGDIFVFGKSSNGNVPPSHSISGADTELDHPDGIALDSLSQNVYVSNASGGSCGSAITVYPTTSSGDVSPTSSIECASPSDDNTKLDVPTGITLDSSNNIYVSNGGGAVTEYAAGANGNVAPILDLEGHRINLTCTAPGEPLSCCTGLNVGNCDKTQLTDPQGIALDSSENIYVTNQGLMHDSITFYAADSSGNVPPSASIQGQFNDQCTAVSTPYACCSGSGMGTCVDNTGLNLPVGLVVDSQGNIYVANNSGEDILEFAPISSASGPQNVAPIATISGGMTQLNIPLGITIAPFQ